MSIFLVTSAIIIKKADHFYDANERFYQTIETFKSIRMYCPDAIIIMLESSKLSDNHIQKLKKFCDHFLDVSSEPSVIQSVNIGDSETNILKLGISFLLSMNLEYNRVFKLSGRYRLNREFEVNKFSLTKYTFTMVKDGVTLWFHTTLYCIPKLLLSSYLEILNDYTNFRVLHSIEKYLPLAISETDICYIDKLGVEGNYSYSGIFYSA